MTCRINLRRDQSFSDRRLNSSGRVTICAPAWVQKGLEILGNRLNGTVFQVLDNPPVAAAAETFQVTPENPLSLKTLQRVSRNESANTTGKIDWSLYDGVRDRGVIISLRDLVRQCCIVGVDPSSHFGGYGCSRKTQTQQRVYVCDLAALQFQQPENSGRLVLIRRVGNENDNTGGLPILDKLIFENVVGERKLTFPEVDEAWHRGGGDAPAIRERFQLVEQDQGDYCYLDALAYSRFVQKDVVLSGTALSKMVQRHHPGDRINFKFLKYGTGFFAGVFQSHLEQLILPAVLSGLEELMVTRVEAKEVIGQVELPFYTAPEAGSLESARIESFRERFGVNIVFSVRDALEGGGGGSRLVTATTNCGDTHAPFGNEMRYGSVDAAVAENLHSKGHIFCPNINLQMNEEFIQF